MKFLVLLLIVLPVFSLCAAETQVYRWVDKDGTVHYADKPNNISAKRITLKENYANSRIESTVKFPDPINKDAANSSANLSTNSNSNLSSNSTELSVEDREYCDYVLEQIELAKENIHSTNDIKVNYATAYLKASTQMLAENGCN